MIAEYIPENEVNAVVSKVNKILKGSSLTMVLSTLLIIILLGLAVLTIYDKLQNNQWPTDHFTFNTID